MIAIMISGCASHGGYRPTVNPYGDPRADRIGQDLYEREALARQASRVGEEAVKGAVVGGVGQGASADQRFVHAYRNCMLNRGHNVID